MRASWTWLLGCIFFCVMTHAQEQTNAFEYVDITKGGLGEFVDGQLRRVTGGVELALRAADPAAKPMVLSAQDVTFLWGGDSSTPSGIQLSGGVSVDGPQGLITANRADLDLTADTLTFSGSVQGKSESIESFAAERIVYDMASGNSEMSGLSARGIKLGKAGAADGFSSMNIDRAGNVVSSGGQVRTMQGGVAISLQPRGDGKPLVLHAGAATFAWSGAGGQPTSIALRGDVRVDGPQGAISAERGDFDLAKKQLVFSGKVNGSLPQIKRFDADTLNYAMDGGETLMTNVRAKGLDLGTSGEKETSKDPNAGKSYTSMDIESAPQVSLEGQKLNWMRGGVKLVMHSAGPEEKPMTITAREMSFEYGESDGTRPQRIVLDGGVDMQSPERNVTSDSAALDFASNTLKFNGNVAIDTPDVKESTATEFSYNITTGQISSKGLKAKSIRVSNPEEEEATP
ncbi:MAG: hypothetical protein SGI88_01940 [Candidatus Hydrogenedentes bacterium]|nr:hypothetical protein [Candidatus Hydrogenedentota bacterium]